jgi:hypothetical protein
MIPDNNTQNEWRLAINQFITQYGRTEESDLDAIQQIKDASGVFLSREELSRFMTGTPIAAILQNRASKAPPKPVPVAAPAAPPRPEEKKPAYEEIGGAIGNPKVKEFIKDTFGVNEPLLATLKGLGEDTGIGALFSKEAGAAMGGDYLLLSSQRVVIVKSGVGTWGTGAVGLKIKTYLLDTISSVDVSSGLVFGDLEVVASGMVEKASGGFFAASTKDSVVQFEKKFIKEVNALAEKIRSLAQSARRGPSVVAMSIPEQIGKLAELHKQGILSDSEFSEKKTELLKKM